MILLLIILLVISVMGFWYYLRLQNAVAPVSPPNSPTSDVTGQVPELVDSVIAEGLSNVWEVDFLPDKTLVFTERAGTISKLSDGKKVVIHTIPDIYARGEGGLMGMAVDPEFERNRFIYTCYNTSGDIRISRWKINDGVTALTDKTDILTGMPANTTTFPGRHSGCRLAFDKQNNLWVGTGDVAIGTNPQNPKSLGGKILRIDRDGKAVAGNLSEPFDARIFSYGHRNTQGLALFDEPKDGSFGYSSEHGPDRDDEINQLVSGNFGWNPVPGYNERVLMTDRQQYPAAIESVWSSGQPAVAPSGAAIIRGAKWKAYESQLAVVFLRSQHMKLFGFDADGRKILSQKELYKNEFGRLRTVVMGPDDDLYVATDNGNGKDKIIRISPL